MLVYIIRRILNSVPVLLAASFLLFTFVSISGDPLGRLRANPNITQQQIRSIEHSKNLDRPVIVRYGYWARDALTKKFGTTLYGNRKIWPDLKRVMGHTIQFIGAALIISLLVGVAIGVYSALRQYSPFDLAHDHERFACATPAFGSALMLQVITVQIFLSGMCGSSIRPGSPPPIPATGRTSCSTGFSTSRCP